MTDEQTPTSKPQDYTKRPVTIQAIKWTGTNLRDVIAFTDGPPNTRSHHAGMMWERYEDLVSREGLKIYAIEGVHTATVGDMIIKGVRGEFYFCNAEIFEETYSPSCDQPSMQPALAEARGRREAAEHACAVIDAHSEYDQNLCCDGRECCCGGESVHDHMKARIQALIDTNTEEPK